MKNRNKPMFFAGLAAFAAGLAILGYFGYQKITRELRMKKLLEENVVLEIPALKIRVPVQEGTDPEILSVSAGHFPYTGAVGSGNYCIAGHNSTIYAEVFNDLDQIKTGDKMYLIDSGPNQTQYVYTVTEYHIVQPNQVEVLNDFGDDRLTVISCTDDGQARQVVVGILEQQETDQSKNALDGT